MQTANLPCVPALTGPERLAVAHDGMRRAVEHANRDVEGWSEHAITIVRCFALMRDEPFLAEDVREYAQTLEFPRAPDQRAWGAVMKQAAKRGVIRMAGFRLAKDGSPKSAWEAA